ncbi:MAG: CvpA family protein [Casimicrobiaceae bacterium]
MTAFDWIVIAIVGLSTLFAFHRGVVREVIALIAWVVGLAAALTLSPVLAAALPDLPAHPAIRTLIAFALILVGTLLVGALIAWPISRAIRALGLGFVDRFLGGVFGLLRGIVVVLALALLAGLTPLPQSAWWQNAALAAPIVAGVEALRPYLPSELANRLDYSRRGNHPQPPSRGQLV